MVEVTIESHVPGLTVALVEAQGVRIEAASAELRELCDRAAQAAARDALAGGDARRQAIRSLLRSGGFKPSGRNKPAQEYLLRTATEEGTLPSISNAVDLINLVSLQSGLPISLVSLDRLGVQLSLRVGVPGEKFVFNRTGQELDVEGLLVHLRSWHRRLRTGRKPRQGFDASQSYGRGQPSAGLYLRIE